MPPFDQVLTSVVVGGGSGMGAAVAERLRDHPDLLLVDRGAVAGPHHPHSDPLREGQAT